MRWWWTIIITVLYVFRSRTLVDGKFRFVSKIKFLMLLLKHCCLSHSFFFRYCIILVLILILITNIRSKTFWNRNLSCIILNSFHPFPVSLLSLLFFARWIFLDGGQFCWKSNISSVFFSLSLFIFQNYSRIADPSQRENLGILVQYKVKVKLCIGGPILGG